MFYDVINFGFKRFITDKRTFMKTQFSKFRRAFWVGPFFGMLKYKDGKRVDDFRYEITQTSTLRPMAVSAVRVFLHV